MIPYFLYSPQTQRNQPDELNIVQDVFGLDKVGTLITGVPQGSIVIPRFRAIPFGEELEQEIVALGSRLVNTYREHSRLADIFYWAPLLENLTPPVYHEWEVPYLSEGEWFVKGQTNSIKNRWFDCCYAPNTAALPMIIRNNKLDVYVGTQDIAIRPFQNYRKLGEAVDGRPVFSERRCFVVNKKIVSTGFYWSSLPEFQEPVLSEKFFNETVEEVLDKIGDIAPFFVVDLAEYEDGSWGVVELNDAVMSGLSSNNPETVWKAVYDYVKKLV